MLTRTPTPSRHPTLRLWFSASCAVQGLAVLLALGALLAGVGATPVHAQPLPPRGRALLFPEPNFRGDPLVVDAGTVIENLEFLRNSGGRTWNDRISSVRLEGPVILVVFEDAEFRGAQATLTRDAADLSALSLGDHRGATWNNRISSLRLEFIQPVAPNFYRWERREAERAVRAAYRDILGRDPDERGLRDYRDRLMERGWNETQLRDNLRLSPEFRSRDLQAIIRKVYREVLGRDPDPSGHDSYLRALRNGMTEAEFRADLRHSAEFVSKAARESITRAYRDLLRRDPDPSGLAYYTKQMLERGWDENRVRESIRASEEYRHLPRR